MFFVSILAGKTESYPSWDDQWVEGNLNALNVEARRQFL